MKKRIQDYEMKNLKYFIEGKETNKLAYQAAFVFVLGFVIMAIFMIVLSSVVYYYREEIDNSAYTGFIMTGLCGVVLIFRVVRKMILKK